MELDVDKEDVPWLEENISSQSTSLPEIIQESNQIGTVIIFVISAILTITLLFVVAVFIDCRQEKLTRLERRIKRPKRLKFKIPITIGRAVREDEAGFANRMQEPEPTSSSVIV